MVQIYSKSKIELFFITWFDLSQLGINVISKIFSRVVTSGNLNN